MFKHTLIPLRRFPQVFPAVTSIFVVQIVVFIMLMAMHVKPEDGAQYGAIQGWRVEELGEYWRLLFSLFLHLNFFSLFFSLFWLYIFAPQLEWLLGRFFFLLTFMIAGVVGNWGIVLFDIPGTYMGVFPAILGLLGVYLYLSARRFIDRRAGTGILILIVIYIATDFEMAGPYLLAVVSGFILGAVFISIRRLQIQGEE